MSKSNRNRRWPGIVLGAALGGASVLALSPALTVPAYAVAAQHGGYVDLVAKVSPAVVSIEVKKKMDMAGFNPANMPEGSPLDEFARRFGMPFPFPGPFQGQPGGEPGAVPEISGVGTGFIISAKGDIVTNNHVVENADSVRVTLADGTSLDARVVGTDPATDLALIRVDAGHDLPFVTWGDSGALQVGQEVIAIGNPFGLGTTVTSGIVSALGRDIHSGPFDNYIQTDAAINKGNSGGPLFDDQGQVIGINTAIFSPTGGSVGIGFAVPSDTARTVIADLARDGTVNRGWLGVSIQPVTEDIAAAIGLDKPEGTLITDVTPDSPAAAAGLKRGDVVVAVDGAKVASPRDLARLVAGDAPGTKVKLELLRAGKPTDLAVTLGTRPEQPA
ncbi:S1C family serine protease [Albidovulum sp.]